MKIDKTANLKAIEDKLARDQREMETKRAVIQALPEDIPAPSFIFAGHKLYGATVAIRWGDSYKSYNSAPNPTLKEAIAILAKLGEPIAVYSVELGCLGIKPDDCITERERESAEIEGPFYGARITREGGAGESAKLEALVTLNNGMRVSVDIYLREPDKFGTYHAERISGRGRSTNFEHEATYRMLAQPAIRYSSGSSYGRSSGSSMVYLFDNADALATTAELLERAS